MIDNPDSFTVVALIQIPPDLDILFTDNGWTGTALYTTEGTYSFTTTAAIPPGYVWSWTVDMLSNQYGYWTKVSVWDV